MRLGMAVGIPANDGAGAIRRAGLTDHDFPVEGHALHQHAVEGLATKRSWL